MGKMEIIPRSFKIMKKPQGTSGMISFKPRQVQILSSVPPSRHRHGCTMNFSFFFFCCYVNTNATRASIPYVSLRIGNAKRGFSECRGRHWTRHRVSTRKSRISLRIFLINQGSNGGYRMEDCHGAGDSCIESTSSIIIFSSAVDHIVN